MAKVSFWIGWLAGSVYFAWIIRWLFAVWPAEWIGLEKDPAAIPLIIAAWLILSVVCGLPVGAFAHFIFLSRHLINRNKPAVLFLIPSAWVIAEYSRAWIFSLISWGQGALLGAHWTFGDLGYFALDTPLAKLAPMVGLYGFSWLIAFFVAAICVLVLAVWKRDWFTVRNLCLTLMLVAILLAGLTLLPQRRAFGKPLSVIVFQSDTRVGLVYREAIRRAIDAFFQKYPENRPDLVVLPEDAAIFSISQSEERELLRQFFPDSQRPGLVVTNATIRENGRRVKYTLYADRNGEIVARQPKTFLIPGGEIMPVVLDWLFRAVGRSDFMPLFKERRQIFPAPLEPKFVDFSGTKLSAAVCSGVITPQLYRHLAASGAEILINQTSFSVFHGSRTLLDQMTRMARFQALVNARPLIQSANAGESLIIDSYGNITASAPSLGNYIIAGTVIPNNAKTLTQRFGDWPVGFSALLIFIYVLFLPNFFARYLKNSI